MELLSCLGYVKLFVIYMTLCVLLAASEPSTVGRCVCLFLRLLLTVLVVCFHIVLHSHHIANLFLREPSLLQLQIASAR